MTAPLSPIIKLTFGLLLQDPPEIAAGKQKPRIVVEEAGNKKLKQAKK